MSVKFELRFKATCKTKGCDYHYENENRRDVEDSVSDHLQKYDDENGRYLNDSHEVEIAEATIAFFGY